ncbi:MAG: hydrogenase maturation protease [Deltaproteobacteria bacterium]|nr:hydrogenase maturation protease [Deltaproteobacteria bacterium]
MKTLILGFGNPILTDDAVGIRIAEELAVELPDITVEATSEAGLSILDEVTGYEKLVIIDSIKTGKGKPGELYKLTLEDLKPRSDFSSSHGLDIATAFKLGEKLGYPMPGQVSIYAVEVKNNTTFGEECTPELKRSISLIVGQIIKEEGLCQAASPKS